MKSNHNMKLPHLCNFCGKMCVSELALKSHLLFHQGKKSIIYCVEKLFILFISNTPTQVANGRLNANNVTNLILVKMV